MSDINYQPVKILHLETSSKNCSVAVSDGTELLCLCEEVSENYKQSENLHTFVQWALQGADVALQDIEAICLGKGPGSYTGLRIGAASAKGFCFGMNIPLIAVNSMQTMSEPFIGKRHELVIPLIDARRMEVYTTVYDGQTGEEISETTNLILDENTFQKYADKRILFVGDGAKKAKDILNLNADYREDVYPSAEFLLKTAVKKFNHREFKDIAYFEPFYLKDFHGTKKTEKNTTL